MEGITVDEQANAVTFWPINNTFYKGRIVGSNVNMQGRSARDWEPIAVLNVRELKKGNRSASVEYVNHEMVRQAERYLQSGNKQAATDATSLANMTRVELMTEIINRMYKDVYLIEGVRQVPVPKLKLDYDIQLHIKRRGKQALVGKRQKGNVESPEFVQVSFDMVKFGKLQHVIDTADEDELSALISPMQTALDDVSQLISQDENLLIYDEMKNFSAQALADTWGAMNTNLDFSKRNPLDDITAVLETIHNNHGRGTVFASNLVTYGKYMSNTYLRGYQSALDRENGAGVGQLPAFPGVKRITDSDIGSGEVYIYDARAISYGVGPMVSETFRDPQAGVSGHIIRKWVQPIIPTKFRTAWGKKYTGAA